MKSVRNINAAATERLMREALPLLTPAASVLMKTVETYVTDCKAGRANHRARVLRVPSWVFYTEKGTVNLSGRMVVGCGPQLAAYYLAHELAHILARTPGHGPDFMAAFKLLCPPELQFYEYAYKPREAARAGIAP